VLELYRLARKLDLETNNMHVQGKLEPGETPVDPDTKLPLIDPEKDLELIEVVPGFLQATERPRDPAVRPSGTDNRTSDL